MNAPGPPNAPDFRMLFESAPGLYLVLTTDLDIVAASDAYLHATMTRRENILGHKLFDVFPDNPNDPSANGVGNVKASLERVLEHKAADTMAMQKYDIRKPQSEGGAFEVRYWRPVNYPVLGHDGEIAYIIHRVDDVTESLSIRERDSRHLKENEALRQRTEQMESEIDLRSQELLSVNRMLEETNAELATSRTYLDNILKHVVDPIFVKDRKHRWIYGNDALWELIGKPKDELLGKSDYDFFPKEEADVFWQKDEEVFNGGKVNVNVENFTDVAGVTHVISTKKARFRMPQGELVLVGIIRDVTEFTRMQDQLRVSNQETKGLLAAIVESSDDAIISRTLEGIVTYWNAAAERLYGYSSRETIGQHINLIVPPDRLREEDYILRQLHAGQRVEHFETVRRTKFGRRVNVSLTQSFIRDAGGQITGISMIARDITEAKRIEGELKASLDEAGRAKKLADQEREKAEAANRIKDSFLANISHEIRTPLNSMIGLTELLLETELSAQQETHIRMVLQSGENLVEIINDLLDFSKIESGKLDLEALPFDLQAAVEDTAELFAPLAREKEQQLELLVHFAPGTPRHVIGDAVRLRQILSNLLNNAIKFTSKGHVMVTVREVRDASLPEDRSRIEIAVADTGIGIAGDKLQVIFDKFTQADISTTRKFGGTGLGLSICRQLARLMGGDVTAQSLAESGSTFSASLVFKHDPNPVQSAPAADLTLLKGKKALIVDSSRQSRLILKAQLENAGVACTDTADPELALDILNAASAQNEPFDFMTTDYLLPQMQSVSFTSFVKSLYPDLPVIMVTALAEKGYSQIFASSGCDAYLTKPVRATQLLTILAMIFEARRAGKQLSMLTPLSVFRRGTHQKTAEDNGFIEGAQILLAEDNRANRDLVVRILENMGCRTTAVRDGEEAVAIVRQRTFDLILMDCQMPEMDGFEASRLLSQMKRKGEIPDTPIIALTANAMRGDREKCLESGMNDYISKPLRKSALRNAFMHWLPPREKRAADLHVNTPDAAEA